MPTVPTTAPKVQAQGAGVNWETVGASVGISLLVNVVVIVVALVIYTYLCRRRHKNKSPNIHVVKDNNGTTNRPMSAATARSISADSASTRLLLPSSPTSSNAPVSVVESVTRDPTRRQKHGDIVAKWCTERGLNEITAQLLRDNGFNSLSELNALRVEDIKSLGLTNIAQECVLLKALQEQKEKPRQQSTTSSKKSTSSDNPDIFNDSGVSSSFNKSHGVLSMDHGDGLSAKRQAPNKKRGLNSDSSKDTGDGQGSQRNSGSRFHGLLSDKGLHQLAGDIGREWPHLASMLNVAWSEQEKLQLNFPNDSRRQIASMLRYWRDGQTEEKEAIKGRLHAALGAVGRNDLAEKIMREQVEGSVEKVTFTSLV